MSIKFCIKQVFYKHDYIKVINVSFNNVIRNNEGFLEKKCANEIKWTRVF